MIIQVQKNIEQILLEEIHNKIKQIGYKYSHVITPSNHYIICIGKAEFDIRILGCLDGVIDIHRVSDSYKLVSKKWRVKPTEIKIDGQTMIKEGEFSVIAGPCSVENEQQLEAICQHLVQNNIKIIRGGVFKPRSSPYTFRGLGIEGLKMFSNISKKYNLKIITEVMEISQIEQMYPYTDIFQVGTRNSQNFNLLEELGKIEKPVLLKRAMSGTIDELLHSAEYIFSSGNENLILCERGIRTYEDAYRNTLDLNAVPILKEKTHLPVIVDPSHGIGIRRFVEPMTLSAIMSGCDGVIIEIHPTPEEALSDAQQTLNFAESQSLFNKIKEVVKMREKIYV
ncbi:MAG: 3-deoxy-7-phosphoheptulonate synthase [Bacteroidetes bacterium GWF2_29_10]|nr:MAG: 3-deoxy-7-phosphoheptulonate synthase [Bacteroidetes bacterium GWF2_29_10]